MPATPQPPFHRWGVRFTADDTKDLAYLQSQYDNDNDFAKRGELFLNEEKEELYYVDSAGTAKAISGVLAYNAVVDADFTTEGLLRRGPTAGSYSVITDNSDDWDSTTTLVGDNYLNWNSAYGWGDHSVEGYLSDSLITDPVLEQTIKFDGTNWVNTDSLSLKSLGITNGLDEVLKEEALLPQEIAFGLTYSFNLGSVNSARYLKIGVISNDGTAGEFGYEEIKIIHDGINVVASFSASEAIYSGLTTQFTTIVSSSIVDGELFLEIGNATTNAITTNLFIKRMLNTSVVA